MSSAPSHFFAQLARMKLIRRWPLMRSVQPENVQEHSLQVAMLAHGLATIKNRLFDGQVNADRVAVLALYHDATEVLTGDMPTPVKYHNPDIAREFKKIEEAAAQRLVAMLPAELRDDFAPLIGAHDHSAELALVKTADTLCAYLKCLEEAAAGNREFVQAEQRLLEALQQRMTPELDYFLNRFGPGFKLTLDEVS
ncbi:MAG: 5'-deoxynucleotidase [Corallincola sp.]|nr:5'-deoxynucleotidase [Corallincola sp.]